MKMRVCINTEHRVRYELDFQKKGVHKQIILFLIHNIYSMYFIERLFWAYKDIWLN